MAQSKTVNLVCISPCKIEGEHISAGQLLKDIEPELAKELAGAGRARLATADDLAGARKTTPRATAEA